MSGLSKIYINGNLIKETKQSKGQKLVQDWVANGIGKSFGDDTMHYVDEVYLYDKAIRQSEVQRLFLKCRFNKMVIHYGFQKQNKTKILDQSGLENDAVLNGGKIYLCFIVQCSVE